MSVLLAAYNGSQFISEQIAAILAQTGLKVTLLISDDRSTDGTATKIECFPGGKRVRVLSPTRRMGAAAKNFFWLIGCTPSEGYDFVSFADQDDVWAEDKLSLASATLRRTGAAGYWCAVTAFWQEARKTVPSQVSPDALGLSL